VKVKPLGTLLLFTAFLVFPPGRAGAQEQEAGFYMEKTGEGFRFVQRFSWKPEEYASFYEVVIQRRESSGNWTTIFSDFTGDDFIEVSLPPGPYRYHVRAYDLIEKPVGNPEWVSFEVLPALMPVLEGFSPRSFPLDGAAAEGAVLTLTVRGRNLAETAEFRLVRKSPAPSADILPLERRGGASGQEAVLVFGGGQLSPGTYELVVVNPGGLSGSLGTLRIYLPEPMPRFAVSLGYKPLIPLYGGLHELLDASFFPAGAYGQFSFLPVQTPAMALGLETDISWTRLSSRYISEVWDYDVSGQYVGLELYGLVQKPLTQRLALNLRLGGGLFSILGFEKKASGLKTEPVNALVPVAGGGLSIRLVFYKSFFARLGAEYTHFFSADDSPPGYLRPFAGMGLAW
jgi:hypothetical protein